MDRATCREIPTRRHPTDSQPWRRGNEVNYHELLLVCLPFCAVVVAAVNSVRAAQPGLIDTSTIGFNWAMLLVSLAPSVALIAWRKYPLALFGVGHVGAARAANEGLTLAAALLAFGCMAWYALGGKFGDLFMRLDLERFLFVPALLAYLAHVTLQEFLVRGCQTSLHQLLGDKRGHLGVLISSLMFGGFHLHFGVVTAALSTCMSVLLGYLYLRHANLAGVTIVHFVLGTVAISFRVF